MVGRLPALTLAVSFLAAIAIPGPLPAGSAGVRNGSIHGMVLGGTEPLEGVYVVALRQNEPAVMRSARSGPGGVFAIPDAPLGEYRLGYSKLGWKPITTEEGTQGTATAVGSQIRVVVESGAAAWAPEVSLQKLPGGDPGDMTVHVVDGVTGEPVRHANLILGPEVAEGDGQGAYRARVAPLHDDEGNLLPQRMVVNADGYETSSEDVDVPGGVVSAGTITLNPHMVTLSGIVALDPALGPDAFGEIQVVVANVPSHIAQGRVVNASGLFEVQVPASNSADVRQYDVSFLHQGAEIATVSGIVAPRAGIRRLPRPVALQAKVVAASGTALSSTGSPGGSDPVDVVVLVELGRAAPISGGSFHFEGVPVGRSLTVHVTLRNPDTGLIEQGTRSVTAVEGGGSFTLPTIITGQ